MRTPSFHKGAVWSCIFSAMSSDIMIFLPLFLLYPNKTAPLDFPEGIPLARRQLLQVNLLKICFKDQIEPVHNRARFAVFKSGATPLPLRRLYMGIQA
jgi:hypothetical protein